MKNFIFADVLHSQAFTFVETYGRLRRENPFRSN
jgi:hypothetical protein